MDTIPILRENLMLQFMFCLVWFGFVALFVPITKAESCR